jgi:two-component system, cell cycle sensor histidine kinase and response regulator CckA
MIAPTMGRLAMDDLDSEKGDRLSDIEVSMAERFTALFEHMHEGVALHEVTCDADGRPIDYRILDINPQYEQHTGLRRADVVGKLASVAYGTESPPYLQEFCSVGLGGPPKRMEVYFPPLARHFSISVAPLGPRVFATIFFDVTLAKQQAEAIEKSRLSQRALLDNQPHLTWLKDRDGRFLAVNQAFADACGQLSPESVVGKTDLDVWPQELAEAYRADDVSVMQSGTQKVVEELIAGSDGLQCFETYKSPVLDPDGSIVGTTGVARDITVRKRAEEARLQSERKFAQVFDLAPDPIVVSTETGELLYANRAFCRTVGMAPDEMVGRRPVELGFWSDPEFRARTIEGIRRDGHLENLEMAAVSKDGTRSIMQVSGALAELDGHNVLIIAAKDVTEHRLAEQKAQQAKDELERYFNLSLDPMCIATTEGRFLRLNPAWEQVLGYPIARMEGALFLDLVHPDDVDATHAATRKLESGQQVIDFQNRYRHADGSWRWLEWRSAPDVQGLVYAVARDITRRQQAEMALRAAEREAARSRELLLGVAELAHIGHFTIDLDTRTVTWTPELFRIHGFEPDSFVPSIEAGRARIHPEDFAVVEAAIDAAARTQTATRLHNRIVRPNGEVRHCLAIIEGDIDAAGKTRVVALVQDLTELRRAEEEQRKLEQQVMQSQKLESLGVLAGGIAHDFNNLLTSILGNADLALSELSPANPACTYLEDIEKVSRRAADLCRQMLAYSGKGRFVVQPLSLNEIVREMAHLLSVSISKKAVIKYNFFPELPSAMADATQLRQVVMNLITNASEAIGELSGVVTLSTGVMDCDDEYLRGVVGYNDNHPPGQYVYLEVSDTGCGMDPETIARIFDPFFTTKFTGRGLGLAAVMGIVRGHQGALRVYSEKGHGTTFKILLPAHHQPAQPTDAVGMAPREWKGHGLVLLVDDEESIRSMGRHILERAGLEVMTAADGREAVDLFAQYRDKLRLVLLDMTMPHLDGEACFRELRRIDPDVKVIMTSGYNEQDVVNRFVGKGLAGFVQKPYKAGDLLPMVLEVLGQEA